jgi:hypothetical protein
MKNIILTVIAFSFTLFVSSCKVSGNDTNISNVSVTENLIGNPTIPTTWRTTYFLYNGVNETGNYTGFNFVFSASNVVKATNSGTIVSGSWIVAADNSGVKLQLTFLSPVDFTKISQDWKVIESTIVKTRLQNGNDYLTFEQ